ncbi:hypothetical protein Tco_0765299 [Tanacetum coccineum]
MSLSLAENVIVAGADNRPFMLDKTQYSSWASSMILYIKGKENGNLLVDSVLNGPFQYGTATVANHSSVVHHKSYQAPVSHQPPQASFSPMDSELVVPSFLLFDDPIASLTQGIRQLSKMEELRSRQFREDSLRAPSTSDVLMAKLSSYDSEILSEVPTHDNYLENHVIDQIDVLKMESKAKEDKNLKEIIELEKKKKALDNVGYKMGQSTQTMHMLTKPQGFYNESHKTALGYQNPLYLTQAQRKVHALYCGHTIVKKHDALSIIDTEETLELPEESRLKMHAKQNDSNAKEKKVNIEPIDYVALNKLSGHFVKHFMSQNMEQSYVDEYNECLELKSELSKKNDIVDKENANTLCEIVEQVRALTCLDSDLDSACKFATRVQELLVYFSATCPSSSKQRAISSTSASGSKPPTSSSKKNKVEDHLRSVKSSLNKKNHVFEPVCNANVKHSVLNANSKLICATCNECMFDAIHDLCVLDYLNDVNVRDKPKSLKRKKNKVWKPTVVPPKKPISITVVKKTSPNSNNSGKLKDITNVGRLNHPVLPEFGLLQAHDRAALSAHQLC